MTVETDLVIVLTWRRETTLFNVAIAYDRPAIADDRRALGAEPISIDTADLDRVRDDIDEYGRLLTEAVFGSDEIRTFYIRARNGAANERLHLRILLDPTSPAEFQDVRWELLQDPIDHTWIAKKQDVLFSRYLSSTNWDAVSLPPRHDLRALVVIANPADLQEFGLEPIDVRTQLARANVALGSILVTELAGPAAVTVERISARLEDGFDVLYLVAHGGRDVHGYPVVILQQPDGAMAITAAAVLTDAIRGASHRPTIAVLSSCGSAGGPMPQRLGPSPSSALGPSLSAAGIPAVIAMQGRISVETADVFCERFFQSVGEHGQVDRAAADARAAIGGRHDWWMPVLFSRLKSGRTWYEPEFTRDPDDTWRAVIMAVRGKHCTPVIGPGLSTSVFGSPENVARRWVERWQMPIAENRLRDLAKVAQYLQLSGGRNMLAQELRTCMLLEIRERHPDLVPRDLPDYGDEDLTELFRNVSTWLRSQPDDPYAALAELELPVYVTTSWTPLLENALTDRGRPPVVGSFNWREVRHAGEESVPEDGTVARPLVYHMFGHLGDPDSLVLSEDDYFQWLIAWLTIRNAKNVPTGIGKVLLRRSLMFLGYRLDTWDFRVLFESIRSLPGSEQLLGNAHVGVQLSPEHETIEPDAAQTYLEQFFGVSKLNIYWGESQRFLAELVKRGRVGT